MMRILFTTSLLAAALAAQTPMAPITAPAPSDGGGGGGAASRLSDPLAGRRLDTFADGDSGLKVCVDIAIGGGTLEHNVSGSSLFSDDTSAGYLRFGFEVLGDSGWGGGARFEGVVTDDDLFASSGGDPSTNSDAELFFHATKEFGSDRFRMPVRLGLFLRGYEQEENATGDTVTWSNIGPRLEFEPEFTLIHGGALRWSLFAQLGAEVGYTKIETDPSTDTYTSSMTALDLSLGTRFQFSAVELELGFRNRSLYFDRSDTVNAIAVPEIDIYERLFVIGVRLRF
jgi:hypothetical protein